MNAQSVGLTVLQAGTFHQHEALMIRGGAWRPVAIPALFALIEHPTHGPILFDTGCAPRIHALMRTWPERLYPLLLPFQVSEGETAAAQLARRGISAADVRLIVLSHLHLDHMGGLRDFPAARIVYHPDGLQAVEGLGRLARLKAVYQPGLLPADFQARAQPLDAAAQVPLPAACAPFTHGWDVLGDGSLLLIDLPGHAPGHVGLFVTDQRAERFLLCGDACWLSRAYQAQRLPSPLAYGVIHDAAALKTSLAQLSALHRAQPGLHIIPSHCPEAAARYSQPSA